MNPSFSVVALTTASGTGYGLLAWLGILNALGVLPASRSYGVVSIVIALALSTAGLLASTFHLGHPERAWRAISQWRSSWLSREGVLALFTYLPALGFAAAWWFAAPQATATIVLGLLAALCGLATVCSQAMIYATLKPIRQWYNGLVLPNLLMLALFSGGVWLSGLVAWWNTEAVDIPVAIAIVAGVIACLVKLRYWRGIDGGRPVATMESATGLGSIGTVRSLEAPHTEENYLLREMGFAIARKHAGRLRNIALVLGFAVPVVLLLLGLLLSAPASAVVTTIAGLAVLPGIYVERWLFFAEATHTVTLYYGRTEARA